MRSGTKKYKKIVGLFNSGSTIQEIKKSCKVSASDIYSVLTPVRKPVKAGEYTNIEPHLLGIEGSYLKILTLEEIKEIDQEREERKRDLINNRKQKIFSLYNKGKTLEEIGLIYKFTRSRAQQIVISELKKNILERLGLDKKGLSEDELVLLDVATKEEIKEIASKRYKTEKEKNRDRIKEKMEKIPPHSEFISVSRYARALDIKTVELIKYFPEIAKEISTRKKKKWSWYYDKCRICGTVSIEHVSYGLCKNCYRKSDIFKDMQEASRIRNKDRWKERLKEYTREYAKRPEVIQKMKVKTDIRFYGGNRENAIQRDKFCCRICGLTRSKSQDIYGCDLYVNHIDRNSKNNNVSNLMTVCHKCHYEKILKIARLKLKKS